MAIKFQAFKDHIYFVNNTKEQELYHQLSLHSVKILSTAFLLKGLWK